MKCFRIILITLALIFSINLVHSEEGHDHSSHAHGDKNHEDEHKDHAKHEDHEMDKKDGGKHDDLNGHVKHEGHSEHKEEHSGHDHSGGGKAVGKGKAITMVDEKKGFKLSIQAIKTLKLKLKTVDGSEFEISKKTLVSSKKIKGIYRYKSGFFKFLPAKIKKETKKGYLVSVVGIDFGDQIVVNGVGLLRVSDIYSTDKSEYGHAH